MGYNFQLLHLITVLHRYYFLLLSLHLSFFQLFSFLLFLDFLLLFSLDDSDAFVEFGKQMWELGVYFVDEVAEVCACFVIDSFEEHNRRKILLEIL